MPGSKALLLASESGAMNSGALWRGLTLLLYGVSCQTWNVTAVHLYLKCTNTIGQTHCNSASVCHGFSVCFFPLTHLNKLDFLYPYQPWKLNVSFSFLTKMCQLWIPMVIACHTSKRYTLQQSFAILGSEVNLSDSCFTALRIMFFSLHQCNI